MLLHAIYNLFGNSVDSTARLDGFSRVKASSIGAGAEIGRHCRVRNSQLGARCKVGKYSKIRSSGLGADISLGSHCWLTSAEVGRFCYFAGRVNLNNIKIGNFCSIGPNVLNHLGNHPTRTFVSTHPAFYTPESPTGSFVENELFPSYGGLVDIGSDVWIGADVLLMDGVTIGGGAVVAARSIVTKDVPPYAVVGGTPAKVLRYRFDEETIERLLTSAWWDRDLEWIKEHAPLFNDADQFLNHLEDKNA